MNFAAAERIAAAVLYEGYILYPYRATSTKNVQRWNFGTLYPQEYAEAQRPEETFRLITECPLTAGAVSKFDIRVRFLQLVRRRAGTSQEWEEGIERSVELSDLALVELQSRPISHLFTFQVTDTVTNTEIDSPAPQDITGRLEIRVEQVRNGLLKLSLELVNTTPVKNGSDRARKDAMLLAFVSAHILLGVTGGKFISLLDTPEEFREAVAECKNVGVFPVLVGEQGQHGILLCSPIILYDYPQIAPESAGDFFDGTEMDEMLALRVLTLTEDEKAEMRNVDDRARRILGRTETLPQDFEDNIQLAVVVDDDLGREFGMMRQAGHRFFSLWKRLNRSKTLP